MAALVLVSRCHWRGGRLPGRKVLCLQADGSGMYLQALWTQAREKLDVTTVIFDQ